MLSDRPPLISRPQIFFSYYMPKGVDDMIVKQQGVPIAIGGISREQLKSIVRCLGVGVRCYH